MRDFSVNLQAIFLQCVLAHCITGHWNGIRFLHSNLGWGAIFNEESTGGQFALDELLLHINVLELKAVLFGLKSLCSHLRQTNVKVLSDNTTAVCAANNMG